MCTCCKEVYSRATQDDKPQVVKFFTELMVKLTRAVIHYESNQNEQVLSSSSPQLQHVVFKELVQYCAMHLPSEILFEQTLISLFTDYSLKNEDLFMHLLSCGSTYHPMPFLVCIARTCTISNQFFSPPS